jgi:HEAT repeat protein
MPLFGPPNVEKLKEKGDVFGLIKALGHKEASLRKDAAMALGEVGDVRAVEPLIAALKEKSPDVGRYVRVLHSQVRRAAAGALGKLGDTRAVDPLIAALVDPEVRSAARAALAKLVSPARANALAHEAKDAVRTRREEAAWRKLEPLIGTLNHEDWRRRQRAAERMSTPKYVNAILQLEKSGDPRAEQAVVAALKDERVSVCCAAAAALRQIDSVGARKALTSAVDDRQRDPVVRAAAWGALLARGSAPPANALITTPNDALLACEMLVACYDRTPGGEGFLKGSYGARDVEDIGRRLDISGGFQLMLDVHALFAQRRPRAARNLEMVWDGVGQWLG